MKIERLGAGAADYMAKMQADVAAGRLPDVAQVIFSDPDFVKTVLGAKALEDIVPTAELAAHLEGMVPNGVALGRLEGRTRGLAYTFSTPVPFYNADLFRQAGLDPDTPPRTWAEVKAAALAISEKTGREGLITGIFGPSAYDWLCPGVILSAGGRVMSEDRRTLTFAAPEAVKAVEMLKDLHLSGAMPNMPVAQAMETMRGGNAGMYLQTSALQGYRLKASAGKFDLRGAPMPAFGDMPTRPTNSGSALVIFSDDPVKQRAAWELMKHLTSDYGYTIITSKIGYLPLRPSAVEKPEYLGEWIETHPLILPNLEQLGRLQPWTPYPGPNDRQILQTMMNAAENAVFGDADPKTAVAEAQARAQAMMPQ